MNFISCHFGLEHEHTDLMDQEGLCTVYQHLGIISPSACRGVEALRRCRGTIPSVHRPRHDAADHCSYV